MLFRTYIGVDYSGAGTPEKRSRGLQVYQSNREAPPRVVTSPASSRGRTRNWNRVDLYHWLLHALRNHESVIIGLDHGFSFPASYFDRYQISNWNDFLTDFVAEWPTDQRGATVEDLRQSSHRRGDARELRLTERWTSSAKSVFQFDVQGSVAKSTHAGLPFLTRLREELPEVHFWPFDGFEIRPGASVVAEVFPSLFRNRYPREDRTVDEQDAYSVCRWLREMDGQDSLVRFFHPPLNESELARARMEGWILGVY